MQLSLSPLLVHINDTVTLPLLQDHMLPYMADERHAPDTLFFVCEEDFRLFARGSMCNCSATLAARAEAAYAASSTAWRARNPAPVFSGSVEPVATETGEVLTWLQRRAGLTMTHNSLFGPPASGTDTWREIDRGMFVPSDAPAQRQAWGISEYLEDMVKICTKAHREDLGDLVWLSYDAYDKKGYRTKVQHSATLVALSHYGAKKLKALVDADLQWWGPAMGWDFRLIAYLQDHGPQFGASYVYPCIGHYQGNRSQSSDTEARRDSHWSQAWVQEGTRREHAYEGRNRWLCGWKGPKGQPDFKAELILPSVREDLRWYTRIGAPESWARAWQRRSKRLAARPQSKKKGSKPVFLQNQSVWNLTAVDVDDNREAAAKRRKKGYPRKSRERSQRFFAPDDEPVATVRRKSAMSLWPGRCCICMYANVM